MRLAAAAEAAGCDAVWTLDVRREPFLLSAAAVSATSHVPVGTNVAVAFARSPTLTAAAAWDLAHWSRGRFVLGLGSQVGPTLEARFGVSADRPAARMRDYVRAVRACFQAFRQGYGGYAGDFYNLRRPAFQPGADPLEPEAAEPPIYVAAVNPVMTGVAGEVADGLAAHAFSTEQYLAEVVRPALAAGAASQGRPPPTLLLQLIVAQTRQAAATQISAYMVPGYRRVLDHAGLGELADRIMAASREGRRAEAKELIDRGCLDMLGVIVGGDSESLRAGIERWRPYADRIALNVPWFGTVEGDQLEQTERMIQELTKLS